MNLLDQWAPKVCVLGRETPADNHVGFAVLLRRQIAPAGVPIIHLSHLAADVEPLAHDQRRRRVCGHARDIPNHADI